MEEFISAEELRELGKLYLADDGGDSQNRDRGIQFILRAHTMGDAEATFIVADLLLKGVVSAKVNNVQDYALSLMCKAANSGCVQARAYLNSYCERRYESTVADKLESGNTSGKLVDFDGKEIEIDLRP